MEQSLDQVKQMQQNDSLNQTNQENAYVNADVNFEENNKTVVDLQEKNTLWTPAIDSIREWFDLKEVDVRAYSPLSLAYIGDTVFDMIIRTVAVGHCNMAANKYHKKVTGYVSAVAQSLMVEIVEPYLTQEELDIYKRGRNSKPYSKAKNASSIEYQRATGLEALVGYLYLGGQMERLCYLMKLAIDGLEGPEL